MSTLEEWGATITETTAYRTPVIAYNIPGLRDSVYQHLCLHVSGLGDVEQLAKAITHLLTDHELRSRLAENAYRHT